MNGGSDEMKRVNRIIGHPVWRSVASQLAELEREREFCRHNVDHLLHVARLAYLENLEKGIGISKELIYCAALLHDIGRVAEYKDGIPHEEAGAVLVPHLMADCDFSEEEMEAVREAVRLHRDRHVSGEDTLRGLLYRADKRSRNCFACAAEQKCRWKAEKKNMYLNL